MESPRIIIEIRDGEVHAVYAEALVNCTVVFSEKSDPDIFKGPLIAVNVIDDPSFLYVMPEIAHLEYECKLEMFAEYVYREPGNRGAWICNCDNTSHDRGFTACLEDGTEVKRDKASAATEYHKCRSCGRIIERQTRLVVGWASIADNQ